MSHHDSSLPQTACSRPVQTPAACDSQTRQGLRCPLCQKRSHAVAQPPQTQINRYACCSTAAQPRRRTAARYSAKRRQPRLIALLSMVTCGHACHHVYACQARLHAWRLHAWLWPPRSVHTHALDVCTVIVCAQAAVGSLSCTTACLVYHMHMDACHSHRFNPNTFGHIHMPPCGGRCPFTSDKL